MNTAARGEIVAAMNVLVTRRGNTADPAEKAVIKDALDTLSGILQDLNQASLLQAAQLVANATDELEKVVASARLGPFDTFLSDIQGVIQRLQGQQAAMHATESLPSADVMPAAPLPAAAVAAALTTALPRAPAASSAFGDLSAEYQAFFDRCQPKPEFQDNLAFYVSRALKFKDVYQDVGTPLGIPWHFIGILHGMECGFNFGTHLHNGDPLSARTVHVPANRPPSGNPPFTWRESARDALVFKGYHHETDWSVPRMLFLFEKYNGFGYRRLGVPSPYLWSFSNLYARGKFVADHEFDPNAVSKQCGAAVILKQLQQTGAA